jgi:hypothetical protein
MSFLATTLSRTFLPTVLAVVAIPGGAVLQDDPSAVDAQAPEEAPQAQEGTTPQDVLVSVEDRVMELYAAVSFGPGGECDWEKLKELMHPSIQLAMPPHPQALMDREAFFDDFRKFIAESPAGELGFHERVASVQVSEFGAIAHALVVFEVRFDPKSEQPLQRGVDSIQFVKEEAGWRIVSIVTEAERGALEIPKSFHSDTKGGR